MSVQVPTPVCVPCSQKAQRPIQAIESEGERFQGPNGNLCCVIMCPACGKRTAIEVKHHYYTCERCNYEKVGPIKGGPGQVPVGVDYSNEQQLGQLANELAQNSIPWHGGEG